MAYIFKFVNSIKRGSLLCFTATTLVLSSNIQASESRLEDNIEKSTVKHLYDESGELLEEGLELFRLNNFSSAHKLFDEIVLNSSNSDNTSVPEFYRALCAIELNNDFVDAYVDRFEYKYGNTPKASDLHMEYGEYLFNKKEFARAEEQLNLVNSNKLSNKQFQSYSFFRGYLLLSSGDVAQSERMLSNVDSRSEYYNSSKYYLGHIEYTKGNYQNAIDIFNPIKDIEEYRESISYYNASINFNLGNKKEALAQSLQLLEVATGDRAIEMNKIAGECLYAEQRYRKALPHLKTYHLAVDVEDVEENYMYGYTLYQNREYIEAIEPFRKTATKNSALGQNGAYRLAECYLRSERKPEALAAFKSAYTNMHNANIAEDALFNYAKLSYELSWTPFNESIKAFDQYIETYPSSERNVDAYKYLEEVYLTTKNYSLALSSIDKIRSKSSNISSNIKRADQRVSYYRGVELLSSRSPKDAYYMFERSINSGGDSRDYLAKAKFWQGDILYNNDDLSKAISKFTQYLNMEDSNTRDNYTQALYSRGYAYFNMKEYDRAKLDFNKVLSSRPSTEKIKADVLNRVGDCQFSQREFANAIGSFVRAESTGAYEPDYALYMNARCLGLMREFDLKTDILETFYEKYPNSDYMDEAIYESGIAYERLNNNGEALHQYKELVNRYPSSNLAPKALLQMGLIEYNGDNSSRSIEHFKRVIENYPNSDNIEAAKNGLKNNYVELNRVDDYFAFLNSVGMKTTGDSEQEALLFLSAERQYMGKSNSAESSLVEYLSRFPYGASAVNANYYLADLLLQRGAEEDALIRFENVIKAGQSPFYRQSLSQGAYLAFNIGDMGSSENYYKLLLDVAEEPIDKVQAHYGLMNCYLFTNRSAETVSEASLVASSEVASIDQVREAKYNMAKSYIVLGNDTKAKTILKDISQETTSIEGAEAKYLMISYMFDSNAFDLCEKEITSFIDANTPHHYWLAKSFILLAKIYDKKGDQFQAEHTLKSLIDNYASKDDGILEEVNTLLKQYSTREPNKTSVQ